MADSPAWMHRVLWMHCHGQEAELKHNAWTYCNSNCTHWTGPILHLLCMLYTGHRACNYRHPVLRPFLPLDHPHLKVAILHLTKLFPLLPSHQAKLYLEMGEGAHIKGKAIGGINLFCLPVSAALELPGSTTFVSTLR